MSELAERPFHIVVQTAFLGDLLLSIGLLKRLRVLHPDRRIGLVCREHLGAFFQRVGLVDEVFEIRKGRRDSYREVAARLRALRPVAVTSAHSSVRTALFVRSLGVRDTVSFHRFWNRFAYRRRVHRPADQPDVLRQMTLLSLEDVDLGARLRAYGETRRAFARSPDGRLSDVPEWTSISLRERLLSETAVWDALSARFDWLGAGEGPLVLIFPGSVWATKRWTESGFAEVARRLVSRGARVVMMGAGNEVALAERLARMVPGVVSLAGQTSLFESSLLLAHADLMIGNDSASVHLAAVADTPTIAIFGPTVIEQGFRPWSDQAWIIDQTGLACRPCGPHGHHQCPRRTHECMTAIGADPVAHRAEMILRLGKRT